MSANVRIALELIAAVSRVRPQRQVAAKVSHHAALALALARTADSPGMPWLAYARFEHWRELFTEPKPPGTEPYATAIWHSRSAHGSTRCGRARTCRSDPHASCWPIGR
jgi:hypothetical protein